MRWRTIKPAVLTQPLVPTLYKTALARTNTALGYRSGAHIGTGDNNIDIGNEGVAGENSTIRIGSASQVYLYRGHKRISSYRRNRSSECRRSTGHGTFRCPL
jgi:hypothetical protein